MSDTNIVWMIGAIVGFSLGYGLGHLRGQWVGIQWCLDLDRRFGGIYAKIDELREQHK